MVGKAAWALEIALSLQADMAFATDDSVVQHLDANSFASFCYGFGQCHISS